MFFLLPSVIRTITIGTMLNFKDGNNGHGLKKKVVVTGAKLDVQYEVFIYT